MRDTGRKTIFGDPILVREQLYIHPGEFFDLESLDDETRALLQDQDLISELTEPELALHEKLVASRAGDTG